MKKRRIFFRILMILGMVAMAGLSLFWWVYWRNAPLDPNRFVQTRTATVFFHGYGSSSHAEEQMARAARQGGVTHTVLHADVEKDGTVHFQGEIPNEAVNPLVLVNYQNNRDAHPETLTKYAYQVIALLKKRYGVTAVNLVGHSMGNLSILYYLMAYGSDPSLPKVQKVVHIAGHFNGILGMDDPKDSRLNESGEPLVETATYKRLKDLQTSYPKGQIEVLNIYGDTGDHSDERVSNASSKSLKGLIGRRVKSYQEVMISGKEGQHSQLHESNKVNQALLTFLWGK